MSGALRTAWVDRERLRPLARGWLLLGAPMLAFGVLLLAAAWLFERQSLSAEGVVVGHAGALGGGGPRRSRGEDDVVPVVAYTLLDGERGEFQGMQVRDRRAALSIGQRVPLRYQRLADGRITTRIDSFGEVWGVPILFVFFGGVFSLAGITGLRVAKRMTPAATHRRPAHHHPDEVARVLEKLTRRRR